jgi:long-chain acyl-CoA synthetase
MRWNLVLSKNVSTSSPFPGTHRPRIGDIMMSFLPLAHMLERCCENGVYYSGGAVGFFSGDIKQLTNDLKVLKPTVMPAVPRLLNRVYDKILAAVPHGVQFQRGRN